MRDHWRKINNAKADELWSKKIQQLFDAIDFCLQNSLWEPTLILVYSGIDAMAWLDRPAGQGDVTDTEFIAWCNRYVLAPADASINAEDLFAARCGLLHSHTAESRRHRQGKVRKVFYSRTTPTGEINLDQLSMNEIYWPVWVDIELLVSKFRDGVDRFRKEVSLDVERAARVYDRVNYSYLVEVDVANYDERFRDRLTSAYHLDEPEEGESST
jgi:hypothetical protein